MCKCGGTYLCSSAEALWVKVGEYLDTEVSGEHPGEVMVRRRHDRMEEVMDYGQLAVREAAEDVFHQNPPLLLTPGTVLDRM